MTQKSTVSVCMITYNHEKFIQEAIEGVLMQQCDFEIELILANDCSTDKTDLVIQEIIKTHPRANWIKYTNHSKNKGMMPNFIWALQQCKGKYIALCEGDDYWTDPLKLQKQVDFLEVNIDYNICFHKVEIYNQVESSLKFDTITREVLETTNIEDLASGNFIHTPSVVLRNNFTIPKWFSKAKLGDWTLYMFAIKDKKIKKLDEVMSVYRLHNQGIWANKSSKFRILNTMQCFELLIKSKEIDSKVKLVLKYQVENFKSQLPEKMNRINQFFKKSRRFLNG